MKPGLIGHRKTRRSGLRTNNNLANYPIPTTPITVISASVDGSVLTLGFNQPVRVERTPNYTTDVAGATVVSAGSVTALEVAITFSESIAAATVVNIPFEDRGIRNSSGGFVATSTFPVGA